MTANRTFFEFFAGGGMARLGLGPDWRCLFANDIDPEKCSAYRANFGGDDLVERDIAELSAADLPAERADLIWGSFPCQDLSLAGARGGISANRSSAFFPFWRLIEELNADGRGPRIIAIENVTGLLTSNNGNDFAGVIERITQAGYAAAACVTDSRWFTPQSRPRLFIFGFAPDVAPPHSDTGPQDALAPQILLNAYERLAPATQSRWIWLNGALPRGRNTRLADIIDWGAPDWHEPAYTNALVAMMSDRQKQRLKTLINSGARRAGTAFRRTRIENGVSVQRVEARFDGLAGCLRTPAGGSSRQIVFAIENRTLRSRLISPREAARLMGLPDDYRLPPGTTAALKLTGDGVCVPVVRWLAETVFEPALKVHSAKKVA
ncbi:DNA cytosine methyltransferase [Hyphococcus sp.]|uniref:DNA cytosine methyltransferase n=1 Tax=Hyphococcus sp. TaxID=2038636 RepID=UPI003CCB8A53